LDDGKIHRKALYLMGKTMVYSSGVDMIYQNNNLIGGFTPPEKY